MDTYGLINLSELDKMIEHHKKMVNHNNGHELVLLHASRLAAIIEIKELCLKLPSGEETFEAGEAISDYELQSFQNNEYRSIEGFSEADKPNYETFEDYITQFTKSERNESNPA